MNNTLNLSSLVGSQNQVSAALADQFAALTPLDVLVSLVIGFLVGLVIAFVYRRCYRGVLFSPSFAMTLVMLTMITTPVVMCIKSDLSLSMGMVGALSIVRFRTAVKDPMDTAYMFWALTMGILLGAGLHIIALVVVAGISAMLLLMHFIKFTSPGTYLLVLHYDEMAEYDIDQQLRRMVKHRQLRSKTVTRMGAEMTYEVRVEKKQDLVAAMMEIEGVNDATLVACQSEAGT